MSIESRLKKIEEILAEQYKVWYSEEETMERFRVSRSTLNNWIKDYSHLDLFRYQGGKDKKVIQRKNGSEVTIRRIKMFNWKVILDDVLTSPKKHKAA